MKLACDLCGGELLVIPGGEAACVKCGLRYSMEALREKLSLAEEKTEAPVETAVRKPYRVELSRVKNLKVRSSVTMIIIRNDRPRPLSEEASFLWETDEARIEIPIYIAKGTKKVFEGVLTGEADGKDIRIVLDVDPAVKMLGVIKETSNSTFRFCERPGATENWTHGQK